MSLALCIPILNNFQKMELQEELSNKNFHFHCSKKGQFWIESFSHRFILLEMVQNQYTKCQGHKKRCPHFLSLRIFPLHHSHRLYLDKFYSIQWSVKDFLEVMQCVQMTDDGMIPSHEHPIEFEFLPRKRIVKSAYYDSIGSSNNEIISIIV